MRAKLLRTSIAAAAIVSAAACGSTVHAIDGSGGAGGASTASSGSVSTTVSSGTPSATSGSSSTTTSGSSSTSVSSTTSATSTTSSTTSSGSSSSGSSLASPPAPGPAQPADGTGAVTFAISKLYVGDTDPDGTPDTSSGWKSYGYNIDGVPAASAGSFCKPQGTASATTVHEEGNNGIENAWGHLILPILLALSSDYSTQVNQSITTGQGTFMLTLDKLGTGSSYNPIASATVEGGNLGSNPKLDGTDVWPYLTGTNVTFAQSYIVGDTWVSAPLGSIVLGGSGSGLSVGFPLHHAVITMPLGATHTTAHGGLISGVISTAEYQAALRQAAGMVDPSLCSGAAIDAVLQQVAEASDIMIDGTQDPTQTCDGISVGLGFDAAIVHLGTGQTPVPPADPCGG